MIQKMIGVSMAWYMYYCRYERISHSDEMKYTYIIVNQCYQAKWWKQNNRWIENSDGLPLTEDWDNVFKKNQLNTFTNTRRQ